MPARENYHHGDLRRALLAAAKRSIAAGETELSLRDVARVAGVSSAAPYRHFENRQALMRAVATEIAEDLLAAMNQATARTQRRSDFLTLARTYVHFATARAPEFSVSVSQGRASSKTLAPVWALLRDAWRQFGGSEQRWPAARNLVHGTAILASLGVPPGDIEEALTRLAC